MTTEEQTLTRLQVHQEARIRLAKFTANGLRDTVAQMSRPETCRLLAQLLEAQHLLELAERTLATSATRTWINLHDAEQLIERVLNVVDEALVS